MMSVKKKRSNMSCLETWWNKYQKGLRYPSGFRLSLSVFENNFKINTFFEVRVRRCLRMQFCVLWIDTRKRTESEQAIFNMVLSSKILDKFTSPEPSCPLLFSSRIPTEKSELWYFHQNKNLCGVEVASVGSLARPKHIAHPREKWRFWAHVSRLSPVLNANTCTNTHATASCNSTHHKCHVSDENITILVCRTRSKRSKINLLRTCQNVSVRYYLPQWAKHIQNTSTQLKKQKSSMF